MRYMTKDGRTVGEQYDVAWQFMQGRGVCRAKDKVGEYRWGAIDARGNIKIPFIYANLRHIEPGPFFAEQNDHQWLSLDQDGNVTRRFPFGFEPQSTQGDMIFGSINKDPKHPNFQTARWVMLDASGRVSGTGDGECESPIPIAVRQADSHKRPIAGIRNNSGWIVEPKYKELDQVGNDRWRAGVEPAKFDVAEWRDPPRPRYGYDRSDLFKLFLEQYNLIGMDRSQVISLLGDEGHKPDGNEYLLICGGCGLTAEGVHIEYENNRVKRWCFRMMMDSGFDRPEFSNRYHWFDRNVVYAAPTNIHLDDAANWQEKAK